MNNTTDENKRNSPSSPPLEKKRLTLKLNINKANLSTPLPTYINPNKSLEGSELNTQESNNEGNNKTEVKDKSTAKTQYNKNTDKSSSPPSSALSDNKNKTLDQKDKSNKDNSSNNKPKAQGEDDLNAQDRDKSIKDKDPGNKDETSIKDKKTKKDKKPKPPPKPQDVHPKAKMKPDEYLSTLKILQKKFPKAFNRKVQLLKIDIHKDILSSSDLNITRIRSFLNLYCNTKRYKKNYVFGRERFDLNGIVVGAYDIKSEKEKTKEISELKGEQKTKSSSASQKAEGTEKTDNAKEAGESRSQENNNIHQTLENNKSQPKPQHNKLKQASVQSKFQPPSQPSQHNKLQQPKFQQNYQPSAQLNKSQQPVQQKKPESPAQAKKLAKFALFEKEMLGKF